MNVDAVRARPKLDEMAGDLNPASTLRERDQSAHRAAVPRRQPGDRHRAGFGDGLSWKVAASGDRGDRARSRKAPQPHKPWTVGKSRYLTVTLMEAAIAGP